MSSSKFITYTSPFVLGNLFLEQIPLNKDFLDKQAPNVPKDILRNPLFCSFSSFSVLSLTSFINKSNASKILTIFMMPSVSLFEIINFVPEFFLFICFNIYIFFPTLVLLILMDTFDRILANAVNTFVHISLMLNLFLLME